MTAEYSVEVKNLETEMVRKLSGDLAPIGNLKRDWDKLLYSLSNDNPLYRAEIEEISTMEQLFVALKKTNFIDYEDYSRFEERLRPIHPNMARIVTTFQARIHDQIKKDAEKSRNNLQTAAEKNVDSYRQSLIRHQEKPKSKKRRRSTVEDEQTSQEDRKKRNRTRGESSNSSRTVTERQKRKLHADMVTKLSEALSSSMGSKWDLFKYNMKYHMNIGDAKLADITNMFTACEEMRAKGNIEIGKRYDELIAVVEDVDLNLVDIINEHLEKMGIEPNQTRKRRRTVSSDSS